MKQLVKTGLSKAEALQSYGGYTVVHGDTYVLSDLLLNPTMFVHTIVTGIEYGSKGESLNMTIADAMEAVRQLMKASNIPQDSVSIMIAEGGWVNNDNESVEEKALVISLPDESNVKITVMAERIRSLFRQQSVIVCLHDGSAVFIDG